MAASLRRRVRLRAVLPVCSLSAASAGHLGLNLWQIDVDVYKSAQALERPCEVCGSQNRPALALLAIASVLYAASPP